MCLSVKKGRELASFFLERGMSMASTGSLRVGSCRRTSGIETAHTR